jgi:hypothetical protein
LFVVVRRYRLSSAPPNGSMIVLAALTMLVWPAVVAVIPLTERKDDGPPRPAGSRAAQSTGAASSAERRLRVNETSIGATCAASRRNRLESAA